MSEYEGLCRANLWQTLTGSAGSSNNLPQAVIAGHQSQNYGVKSERQKFKGMETSEIIKNHYILQFKGMENNEIIKKHSISQFKGNGK